jgi:hypothetical protein
LLFDCVLGYLRQQYVEHQKEVPNSLLVYDFAFDVEHDVDVARVGHHQNVRSYLRRTHLLYDVSSDVEQASSGDVMNSYELSETEQMWTSSGPQHEARRLPLLQ